MNDKPLYRKQPFFSRSPEDTPLYDGDNLTVNPIKAELNLTLWTSCLEESGYKFMTAQSTCLGAPAFFLVIE